MTIQSDLRLKDCNDQLLMYYVCIPNKFVFSFKSISLLFTQFRVPPFTIRLKQQQFTLIVIILYTSFAYNNNFSIHLYNRDLQTLIILFTCNMSSHKTDWILSELPLFALLSCLLYGMVSSLMNAFEREYLCLFDISVNVNQLLALLLLPVYLFIRFFVHDRLQINYK